MTVPRPGVSPSDDLIPETPEYEVDLPEDFFNDTNRRLDMIDLQELAPVSFESPLNNPRTLLTYPRTVVSLVGLSRSPKNLYAALTHPVDYLTNDYNDRLINGQHTQQPDDWGACLSQSMSSISTAVANRTLDGVENPVTCFVDDPYTAKGEDYIETRNAVGVTGIAASAAVITWAGSKNTDGAGRQPMFYNKKGANKFMRMGALPMAAVTQWPIFMMGGSISAQYRGLNEEGYDPVSAYAMSASPYGWQRTMFDKEHQFQDYVYADFMAMATLDVVAQYVNRAANISAVFTYAQANPTDFARVINEMPQQLAGLNGELAATRGDLERLRGEIQAGQYDDMKTAGKRLQYLEGHERTVSSRIKMYEETLAKTKALGFESGMTGTKVRAWSRSALKGALPRSSTQQKAMLEGLEATRNLRMATNAGELGALRQETSTLKRFAMGGANALNHGRSPLVMARYVNQAAFFYGENYFIYKYVWGKNHEESLESAASVWWTILPNQVWYGGLKSAGVENVPVIVDFLPSALGVNLGWSVAAWDDDINLKKCQAKAGELLHSDEMGDPEHADKILEQIDHLHSYANEDELEMWFEPRSEGGCGINEDRWDAWQDWRVQNP